LVELEISSNFIIIYFLTVYTSNCSDYPKNCQQKKHPFCQK